MACESCRLQTRTLLRAAIRASAVRAAPARTLNLSRPTSSSQPAPTRWFSNTPQRRILGMGTLGESYRVLGASEKLYKICAQPADYHISEEARNNDQVERLEDGEELGTPIDAGNVWHKTRVRCFERDTFRNWQQQLVDHFFFDCEKKMHLDHNITSSALRQRYLKDIFVQWRGLLLAYDEGLIKGDAILASAVWRNLFKGAPEVDPRSLCAIVGWMRSSLASLEAASDVDFPQKAGDILARPVDVFWSRLEEPFKKAFEGEAKKKNGE
ncbi:Ubiquinol-cytochrome C chaperone, partial [Metarhizium brunneum ARSEF 3297]